MTAGPDAIRMGRMRASLLTLPFTALISIRCYVHTSSIHHIPVSLLHHLTGLWRMLLTVSTCGDGRFDTPSDCIVSKNSLSKSKTKVHYISLLSYLLSQNIVFNTYILILTLPIASYTHNLRVCKVPIDIYFFYHIESIFHSCTIITTL